VKDVVDAQHRVAQRPAVALERDDPQVSDLPGRLDRRLLAAAQVVEYDDPRGAEVGKAADQV
jgi:hypothetical protein